ncbi:F-box protein PP2-A11-like [Rutidosis leptorrhynchoides]|uniref:F-box protein PP2-A11-like n=1 Tax=Rutidosis leptorrhynchoides TaxID=125765 RepID=UPI003A999CE5
MGANTSSLSHDHPLINLGDLPESCVALILSYLNPVDICKLARVNRAFRSASTADFIWISKLPSNYRQLVETLSINDTKKLEEKQIFAKLSRPVSFDADNHKKFWVDKRSGAVCVSICSKALTITGINDRRYWNYIPSDESRYPTVAYLKQIWWLEVHGAIEFPLPVGTYSLSFKLHLGKVRTRKGHSICSRDDVHGWDAKPVEFKFTTENGQHSATKRFLKTIGNWEYHHVGEFIVDDSNTPTNVKFSLTQIDCTHAKGGLCISSVLICSSNIPQNSNPYNV